ncbi:PrgI family protein, partial [Micromonospora sp. M51]|nr:PrgI family protein [Micromonospora sp. M51]
AAADDYAEFLLDLDSQRDPLRRQVLAVISGELGADAAVRALCGLGVEATVLDGPAVASALAGAVDPFSPPVPGPRAVPGAPITLRSTS